MTQEMAIALCEDDPRDEERVRQFVDESPIPTKLATFSCAQALLEDYTPGIYQLILMDIYMDEPESPDHVPQGVEAMRRIRRIDPTVPAMFITTSKDFALEGYRLNVARYLEKPVTREAIEAALSYAQALQASLPGVTLRCDGRDVTLPFSQIIYLEQDRHYVLVHRTQGEPLRVHGTLDGMAAKFDPNQFVRTHKSYLANLSFVEDIDPDLLVLRMYGGGLVQVRRRSLQETQRQLDAWLLRVAGTRA